MSLLESIILGLTQGITEFLPISSSGHLILIPKIFNWSAEQPLEFDAVLHLATLFAVLIYFRKEITQILKAVFTKNTDNEYRRLGWIIVVATIPALILGAVIKFAPENPLRDMRVIIISLIGWAIVMLIADYLWRGAKETRVLQKINWRQGIVVGFAQALALIPGTSRSGITIITGLFEGMNRKTAAKFSFLLGIPAITAAGTVSLLDIVLNPQITISWIAMLAGFISAMVSGYFAIIFLLKIIERFGLGLFAAYRIILGLILLWFFW